MLCYWVGEPVFPTINRKTNIRHWADSSRDGFFDHRIFEVRSEDIWKWIRQSGNKNFEQREMAMAATSGKQCAEVFQKLQIEAQVKWSNEKK